MESERERTGRSRSSGRKAIQNLWKRTSAAHKRLVVLFVVLGAALRMTQLFEAVTYEESYAYLRFATMPVRGIITDYSDPLNSVLHTLLMKLSTAVLGVGVVQMRLPAFLAGVLCLPLIYLFARAMFNRYIALMTMALCAASGPLIQYSALATGHSLTWMFFLLALLLGRQLARTNALWSAVLLALALALGFYTTPVMVYHAAMVYIWAFVYVMTRYDRSARQRAVRVLTSFVLFVLISVLLYAPVVFSHGIAQLFYHPTMGDNSWTAFSYSQHTASIDLWLWISSTSGIAVSLLGVVAQLYSVYVSTKFRALILSLALSCIPLVLVHRLVGPPQQWAWTLFLFHLGSGIAAFYLLKALQLRLWPGFSKRRRTVIASAVLMAFFAWKAIEGLPGMVTRYAAAKVAAHYLATTVKEHDRVLAEHPWAAPLEFYLLVEGVDPKVTAREPVAPCTLHLVVSPGDGQTPESVLVHNKQPGHHSTEVVKVKRFGREIELFVSRLED